MWIYHPNSLHIRRLWKIPEPLSVPPICWRGIVILPILHRLVQRLNGEMLIKSLLQSLAHKKYSISNQRRAQFVVSHGLNWDSKASKGQVERAAASNDISYTVPDITGGWWVIVNLASFQKSGQRCKSHLGKMQKSSFYGAFTHSPLQYFSVGPWEVAWLHTFLR